MNTKPIIHVHYTDDDYKLWNPPLKPNFEKYLLATPGRIFESCGGFDPLDVLSVSGKEIVIKLDEKTKSLHPLSRQSLILFSAKASPLLRLPV